MYYLIVNPVAGRGRALKALPQVERFFREQQLELEVLSTKAPGDARRLVEQLPADATVLSLGGDGTLHEIAGACVYTSRTIGILPAGSGDDFAFALGIPRHDLFAALQIARNGNVRQVDTGCVNSEVFVNSFGVGFDADVAHAVYSAPSFLKEFYAYLYAVVSTLRKLKNITVQVTIDGRDVYEGSSLLVAVQNGPRTGGSFLFSPEAKLDDGLLDIVIAGQFGRLATLGILPGVIRGQHLKNPRVQLYRGREVRIHWETARPAHMEGELLAAAQDYHIRLQAASLRVIGSSGHW